MSFSSSVWVDVGVLVMWSSISRKEISRSIFRLQMWKFYSLKCSTLNIPLPLASSFNEGFMRIDTEKHYTDDQERMEKEKRNGTTRQRRENISWHRWWEMNKATLLNRFWGNFPDDCVLHMTVSANRFIVFCRFKELWVIINKCKLLYYLSR